MTEHYTTADGVDVTEGDSVYFLAPYGFRIVGKRIGRMKGRSFHHKGHIPFVGGSEGDPAKVYFDKRQATAHLLADVGEAIAAAVRQVRQAQSEQKRLRKLSAALEAELTVPAAPAPNGRRRFN